MSTVIINVVDQVEQVVLRVTEPPVKWDEIIGKPETFGEETPSIFDDFLGGGQESGQLGNLGWHRLDWNQFSYGGLEVEGVCGVLNVFLSFGPGAIYLPASFHFNDFKRLEFKLQFANYGGNINQLFFGIGDRITSQNPSGFGRSFGFLIESNSPNWKAIVSDNTSLRRVVTEIPYSDFVAVRTLKIEKSDSNGLNFYIDNVLVAEHTANFIVESSNFLVPKIEKYNAEGITANLLLDYVKIYLNR